MFKKARLDDVKGGLALETLEEGMAVVMAPHSQEYDFGSWKDIPGFRKPASSAELVPGFVYFATHKILDSDYQMPLYRPYPEMEWSLRMGFDRPANVPFTSEVYLTPPSVTEGAPIPSGSLMLAMRGVAALFSGLFTTTIGLEAGASLTVETIGADAGKFKPATASDVVVAKVVGVEENQYLVELL